MSGLPSHFARLVSSRKRDHVRCQRSFQIEQLEVRHYLSATSLFSLISPSWFGDFTGDDQPRHANPATLAIDGADPDSDIVTLDGGYTDDAKVFDWIVQFDTNALNGISSAAETTTLLADAEGDFQVLRGLGLPGQVLVRSSAITSDYLAANPYVADFELDVARQLQAVPNDSYMSQLWGLRNYGQSGGTAGADINAESAWNLTTGSSSVVVGVIDTGVDYTHVDLAANIWTNPGEIAGNGIDDDGNGFVDDVHGYDFANNDADPMDDHGHGTHCAGTIAGVGNNGRGVAGVNWSGSVMGLKFITADGWGYTSDAIQAVNYATMMRASYGVNVRVLSNSWGGGSYSSSLYSAVQASAAADILFVAAAGNSSTNNDVTPHYPSNYNLANVLSVAASDRNDQLAYFSNYGTSTVHLAAPGMSIYSTMPGGSYGWMSGTSMATPHVAGVAGLAWSFAPGSSMAEIRNAILQGTDSLGSLSSFVATGGRLNAYNTLQQLGGTGPQDPIVASLTAAPDAVTVGDSVTLTAGGAVDPDGTVTGVSFYRDANANGAYDAGDALLGTDSSVVGGVASIAVDTTGLLQGDYTFFARALDNEGGWSSAVSTTVTVVAPDDHGNNAGTATAVAMGQTVDGVIGLDDDVDWFAFQASAGRAYVFSTTLMGLDDSVIVLYGPDGATPIATDDDGGPGLASRLEWSATGSGTFYLTVAPYPFSGTGTYQVSFEALNNAPVLQPIADQTMSYNTDTLSITLSASDADGDPLSYSAEVLAVDPTAQLAYGLEQQWDFCQYGGTWYENCRGLREKYFYSAAGAWFYILADGALYRWGGSIAGSTLTATLSSEYHADPFLLTQAQAPGSTVNPGDVTLNWVDNVLIIDPVAGYTGQFHMAVTVSDAASDDSDTFRVSVTNAVPVLESISDRTMSYNTDTLSITLSASDADGDPLSYSAEVLTVDATAQLAYELEQQWDFCQYGGTWYENCRGLGEKYFYSAAGTWFYILADGGLYRWGGSIASSTLLATLSSEYHADPFLLTQAQAPGSTVNAGDVTLSWVDNVLVIDPVAGYTGQFHVTVTVSDAANDDSDTFRVSVTNDAPVLESIGDQTMSYNTDTLSITLSASDADGDPLSYSAEVLAVDATAQLAHELEQQWDFCQYGGTWHENCRGLGAKYFYSDTGTWFYILADGGLYRWGGSIADSTLLATLNSDYHADPFLLTQAQAPGSTVNAGDVTLSWIDNVLIVDPVAGYTGTFQVEVTVSGGSHTASETFAVAVANTAPTLAPVADQTMPTSQDTLSVTLSATDIDGDSLSFSADVLANDAIAELAYELDQQTDFCQYGGSWYENCRGLGEKYIYSTGGTWFYILADGELYRWGGSIDDSTLEATLSADYHADPFLLIDAQPPGAAISEGDVAVVINGNQLTIDPVDALVADFEVRVTVSDGVATANDTFLVSVTEGAASVTATTVDSTTADVSGLPASAQRTGGVDSLSDGAMRLLSWTAIGESVQISRPHRAFRSLWSDDPADRFESRQYTALFADFAAAHENDASILAQAGQSAGRRVAAVRADVEPWEHPLDQETLDALFGSPSDLDHVMAI